MDKTELIPYNIEIENRHYTSNKVLQQLRQSDNTRREHYSNKERQRKLHSVTPQQNEDDTLFQFVGDGLGKKAKRSMRLYYNNCNGLSPNRLIKEKMVQKRLKQEKRYLGRTTGDSKIEKMLATLKDWETDVICLSETNVSWDKPVMRQIFNLVKAPFAKESCWVTSASKTKSASLVKPGGTAMLIDTGCTGNIVERGQDWTDMGRWTYISLKGKNDTILTLVTGYRCNKITTTIGDTTAWAQQYSMTRQRGVANPRPHVDFLQDLEKWLLPKILNGEEVLISLDANEQWGPKTKIRTFASKMGLKNIAAETHENLPPSRPQSKRTIDFILGTRGVLDSVLCLSMVPYDLENLGDHRGIIMDLDLEMLLGRNTQHKQQFSQRKLRTSDVKVCELYMDKLEEKFTYHNIYERTKRLAAELDSKGKATKYLLKQYNSLHTDIYRSCKHAEKIVEKHASGSTTGRQNWIMQLMSGDTGR